MAVRGIRAREPFRGKVLVIFARLHASLSLFGEQNSNLRMGPGIVFPAVKTDFLDRTYESFKVKSFARSMFPLGNCEAPSPGFQFGAKCEAPANAEERLLFVRNSWLYRLALSQHSGVGYGRTRPSFNSRIFPFGVTTPMKNCKSYS